MTPPSELGTLVMVEVVLTRFGRYTLHEKIATGGMAELYKATLHGDHGFERPVAIKCILPHLALDETFVRMLVEEAKIAVQLTHSNIAQVIDLGSQDGRYYIAQEYVHGRDLRWIQERERERGETVPVPVVLHVMMKACEALDYAHGATGPDGTSLGIIHRDVSPQNMLVSYEGEVKVIDFGLAKAADRAIETQVGVVKGKLAYMSPEQARGEDIDHRSDIYALGTCLFELLTGRSLFARQSDVDTIVAVQKGEVPRLRDVAFHLPRELDDIVSRALAAELGERYPSALDMYDALEAFAFQSGERLSRTELAFYLESITSNEPERSKVHDTIPSPPSEEVEADVLAMDQDVDEHEEMTALNVPVVVDVNGSGEGA